MRSTDWPRYTGSRFRHDQSAEGAIGREANPVCDFHRVSEFSCDRPWLARISRERDVRENARAGQSLVRINNNSPLPDAGSAVPQACSAHRGVQTASKISQRRTMRYWSAELAKAGPGYLSCGYADITRLKFDAERWHARRHLTRSPSRHPSATSAKSSSSCGLSWAQDGFLMMRCCSLALTAP